MNFFDLFFTESVFVLALHLNCHKIQSCQIVDLACSSIFFKIIIRISINIISINIVIMNKRSSITGYHVIVIVVIFVIYFLKHITTKIIMKSFRSVIR